MIAYRKPIIFDRYGLLADSSVRSPLQMQTEESKPMNTSAILEGKHALVFGAGGSVGAAAAGEFASQGATVFLSGRSRANLEPVVEKIRAGGGLAQLAVVDACDPDAVQRYVDGIARDTGRIDAVFNAMGPATYETGTGKSGVELTLDEFMAPLTTIVKSQFITARAAARHMLEQHSGVIIFLTGGPAKSHARGTASVGAAFGAIEAMTRNLALDFSPGGVRVVCVRSAAMPDSRTIQQVMEALVSHAHVTREQAAADLANLTMLKVSPSVNDTAKAAAFLASDNARMMTGTVLNSTGGAVAD
jgi:NAD(P)-dependent dehydrogenase (short-subunit alcohol dehydrogenase family)